MEDSDRVALRFFVILAYILSSILLSSANNDDNDQAFQPGSHSNFNFGEAKSMRFLLYEVNPGEGFNLRRDVYMRVANLVKKLNEHEPWTLVVPPWGRLYHWRSAIEQERIPWKTFFDLESLSKHVPVIEFEDFLKVNGEEIEEIYYLQKYKEGWSDGKWEEKMDERECIERTGFHENAVDGKWQWWFWGFENVHGKRFKCISIQAQSTYLSSFLTKQTGARVVFIHRFENLVHRRFGDPLYWEARRSMRFAKHLKSICDEFREKYLDSSDENDNTIVDDDWREMRRKHGEAKGGPYLAVHLRRRDFLYGHKDDVPSIEETAKQIDMKLKEHNLKKVFVATDAPQDEYDNLKTLLSEYEVYRYEPSDDTLTNYKDGGVAIIDQMICSYARYFMGTSVSTFTFRIHEEREILGFDPSMTFNRFCGDGKETCEQPSQWTIKYTAEDERRSFRSSDEL